MPRTKKSTDTKTQEAQDKLIEEENLNDGEEEKEAVEEVDVVEEVEEAEDLEEPTVTNWASESVTLNNNSEDDMNIRIKDVTHIDPEEIKKFEEVCKDVSNNNMIKVLINRGKEEANPNPALRKGAEKLLLMLNCIPLRNMNSGNDQINDFLNIDPEEIEEFEKVCKDLSNNNMLKILINRGKEQANPALKKEAEKLLLMLNCVPLRRRHGPRRGRGRGRRGGNFRNYSRFSRRGGRGGRGGRRGGFLQGRFSRNETNQL